MNINRKSWHYKYNAFYTTEYKVESKKTLCSYFWFTFFNIAFSSIMMVFLVGAITCIGYGVCDSFSYESGYMFLDTLMWFGFGLLSVSIIISIVVGVFWAGIRMEKTIKNRRKDKIAKESSDGLLISFIKAKKSKICPIIEFKD